MTVQTDKLLAALNQLDPADDAMWTGDGYVRLEALTALLGEPVTRNEVKLAAPAFNREAAQAKLDNAAADAAQAELDAAGAALPGNSPQEPETTPQSPEDVQEANLDDERVAMATGPAQAPPAFAGPVSEADAEVLAADLAAVEAELEQGTHGVDAWVTKRKELEAKRDNLRAKRDRANPPMSLADQLRAHIDNQAAQRARRVQAGQRVAEVIAQETGVRRPNSKPAGSPLDQTLGIRRQKQRPSFPRATPNQE